MKPIEVGCTALVIGGVSISKGRQVAVLAKAMHGDILNIKAPPEMGFNGEFTLRDEYVWIVYGDNLYGNIKEYNDIKVTTSSGITGNGFFVSEHLMRLDGFPYGEDDDTRIIERSDLIVLESQGYTNDK